jgi:hypothetical protein
MGNNPPNAKQGLQRNKGPSPPSRSGAPTKTSDTKEVMTSMAVGLKSTATAYKKISAEVQRRINSKDAEDKDALKNMPLTRLLDVGTRLERQVSGALQSMAVMRGQGAAIGTQVNIQIVGREGRDPKKIQENFPIVEISDSGSQAEDGGGRDTSVGPD